MAADMLTPLDPSRPGISSLSPSAAGIGQTITINGSGLNGVQGPSTVTISGVAASVVSWTNRAVTVVVPAVSDTGSVTVVVDGQESNWLVLTLVPPPHITRLSVTSGPVGQALFVEGSSFRWPQGASTVTFNGTPATVVDWESSSISVTVPPGATTGPVAVTVGGRTSNAITFWVAPHVSSISLARGAAGQPVTITGNSFGATQGSSTVKFNGVTASIASWSGTSIGVIAPAGNGSLPVVVTVDGLASNALSFWIDPSPAISSLTPATGNVGQVIGIAGTDFGAVQGSSTVSFNGVSANVASWANTAILTTVPDGASSGALLVTVNGHPSNSAAFIVTTSTDPNTGAPNPLSITAATSTSPNAAGWFGANVTVTFTCSDAQYAVTSCPFAKTIFQDGTGIIVGGVAVDAAGNRASTSVVLNVDHLAPSLTVFTPRASAVFPSGTSSVTIKGSVADATSGVASVSCNGVGATLTAYAYSCAAPANDGSNTIHVVATDRADHATTKDVTVTVGDIAATTLTISPAKATLAVGWDQQLSVTDEYGRIVTGGTWSSSAPAVAEVVVENDVPAVHALAAGTATVTLFRDGLTGNATVTVLAAGTLDGSLPSGTVLWELTPSPLGDLISGGNATPIPFQRGEVSRLAQTDATDRQQAALAFVEHSMYDAIPTSSTAVNLYANTWPTRIRGTSLDGRELWMYSPATPARQVAVDNWGGLILNLGRLQNFGYDSSREHAIQRLAGNGTVSWEYVPGDPEATISEAALHPNGTVLFVENTPNHDGVSAHAISNARAELVALDGATGSAVGRWGLHNTASGPFIREDGSVVVASFRQGSVDADKSLWLVELRDGGSAPTATVVNIDGLSFIWFNNFLGTDPKVSLARGKERYHPVPDGHGGVLLPVGVGDSGGAQYRRTVVYRIDSSYTATGTLLLNEGSTQLVVGEDAAWALSQEPYRWQMATPALVYAFDPVTLSVSYSDSLFYDTPVPSYMGTTPYMGPNQTLRHAKANGGMVFSGPRDGNTTDITPGITAGWTPAANAPELQTSESTQVSTSIWAHPQGDQRNSNAASDPSLGLFAKGHIVIPTPESHVSIRIVPKNQSRWVQELPQIFNNDDGKGHFFATIGAGATVFPCFGSLKSDVNRPGDVGIAKQWIERLQYPPILEDTLIERLFQRDSNYHDDLAYGCTTLVEGEYNSNSYAHGLLDAADIPPPVFPLVNRWLFVGWGKTVPASNFVHHP